MITWCRFQQSKCSSHVANVGFLKPRKELISQASIRDSAESRGCSCCVGKSVTGGRGRTQMQNNRWTERKHEETNWKETKHELQDCSTAKPKQQYRLQCKEENRSHGKYAFTHVDKVACWRSNRASNWKSELNEFNISYKYPVSNRPIGWTSVSEVRAQENTTSIEYVPDFRGHWNRRVLVSDNGAGRLLRTWAMRSWDIPCKRSMWHDSASKLG